MYISKMVKNALNYPLWLEEILKFTEPKGLKYTLNYPFMVREKTEISLVLNG